MSSFPPNLKGRWLLILLFAGLSSIRAAEPGSQSVASSPAVVTFGSPVTAAENRLTLPVLISGGMGFTDMALNVRILSNSNAPVVPNITGVSFTNSLWRSVSGGYIVFNSDFPASTARVSAAVTEPNSVAIASGELFRIELDLGGVPEGNYTITLTNSPAGTVSSFYQSETLVPAEYFDGTIQVSMSAAPPFSIRPVLDSSRKVQVQFPTVAGARYQVQWASALNSDPARTLWTTVNTIFNGSGQTQFWSDDSSIPQVSGAKRFYRVMRLQN